MDMIVASKAETKRESWCVEDLEVVASLKPYRKNIEITTRRREIAN